MGKPSKRERVPDQSGTEDQRLVGLFAFIGQAVAVRCVDASWIAFEGPRPGDAESRAEIVVQSEPVDPRVRLRDDDRWPL